MNDKIMETLLERDNKNYESLTVNDQFQETDPLTHLEFLKIPSISEVLESERNVPTLQEELEAKIKRHMVYNLCGYVLYSWKSLLKCEACLKTLQTEFELLPQDFYEHVATSRRERHGGLKFCTPAMFKVFLCVEDSYRKEVDLSSYQIRDWFERTMDAFSDLRRNAHEEITICCDEHRKEVLPNLILEYLVIRNFFNVKEWVKKNNVRNPAQSLRKQAKVVQ